MRKFLFVILALLLLCSCATKTKIEYVDREVVKYQKQFVHDTLIQHTNDSVLHTIIQKGDTVFDTQYIVKTKYQDRVVYKADTCFRDSIQTQYKEKVKEITKIPKFCYFCIGFSIIVIIFAFYKFVRWIQVH